MRRLTGIAIGASALAVAFDIVGNAPNFAALLFAIASVWALLVAGSSIAKKAPLKTAAVRLATPAALAAALPLSVAGGLAAQSVAMSEAQSLRVELLAKMPASTLTQAYAERCAQEPSKSCGFLSYKITPADGYGPEDSGT